MNWWSRKAFVPLLCGWFTIVALICGVHVTAAQESLTESRPKFDVTIGTWISVGDTRWAHNASSSSPLLGDPTSKLTYKDVGTNVFDLAGTLWFTPQLFGRLNFGIAGIGGGRLTDDDFLAADRGNPSSRTISDLSGDGMWYLNADAGGRVTNFPNHRGWLDVFGGFQYWHTEYTAVGLGQVTCTTAGSTVDLDPSTPGPDPLCAPGTSISSGVNVITNTTNWYSIRLGGKSEYRLTRRFSVLGTLAFIPASLLDNKDVHHLRADLSQDPSFSMVGYGVGADADVGARFMITTNLAANVGYRMYYNRVLSGHLTTHPVVGSSESFPLTQFESLRHGFTASLSLIF